MQAGIEGGNPSSLRLYTWVLNISIYTYLERFILNTTTALDVFMTNGYPTVSTVSYMSFHFAYSIHKRCIGFAGVKRRDLIMSSIVVFQQSSVYLYLLK